MSVRSTAIAVAAAGALTLTGCADEPATSAPEPSAAPSTSPSPSEPALAREVMAEEPSRPRDTKTPAGAARFGGYVVESLWYGTQQRDLSLLWSLVHEKDTCDSCSSIEESIEEGDREGIRQLATEPVKIKDSVLLDRAQWVVGVSFKRPGINEYDEQGEKVDSYRPAGKFIEMGLEWHGGKWTLYDFRYAED